MATNLIVPITVSDALLSDHRTGGEDSLFYVLETAQNSVAEILRDFAQSPEFAAKMELAFGQGVKLSELQEAWAAGEGRSQL